MLFTNSITQSSLESPYKIFAKDDGVSVSLIEYASNAVTY